MREQALLDRSGGLGGGVGHVAAAVALGLLVRGVELAAGRRGLVGLRVARWRSSRWRCVFGSGAVSFFGTG